MTSSTVILQCTQTAFTLIFLSQALTHEWNNVPAYVISAPRCLNPMTFFSSSHTQQTSSSTASYFSSDLALFLMGSFNLFIKCQYDSAPFYHSGSTMPTQASFKLCKIWTSTEFTVPHFSVEFTDILSTAQNPPGPRMQIPIACTEKDLPPILAGPGSSESKQKAFERQ